MVRDGTNSALGGVGKTPDDQGPERKRDVIKHFEMLCTHTPRAECICGTKRADIRPTDIYLNLPHHPTSSMPRVKCAPFTTGPLDGIFVDPAGPSVLHNNSMCLVLRPHARVLWLARNFLGLLVNLNVTGTVPLS